MTLPNARECVLGRALDRRTGQHAHEMIAIFEEDGGTWEQVRDAVHATAAALSVMPAFMLPRFVDVVAELPRTEATLRVRKAELRARGRSAVTWDAAAG